MSDHVSRGMDVADRWPELVVDREARPRSARPPWLPVAAFILLLNGLMVTVLAGFAGATLLVPGLTVVVGVAAIVAAFGLALQTAWGRGLAALLAIYWLAQAVGLAWSGLLEGRPMFAGGSGLLVDVALPVAVNAVLLFLVLRRWPAAAGH